MINSQLFSRANAIRLLLLGGLVAVIFVFVQSCQQPKTGLDRFATGALMRLVVEEAPPTQPRTEFVGPDGQTMTLSDYKGSIILLNVWATWCPPCVKEMPMLDGLQAMQEDDGFSVVTISLDRIKEEPAEWFETHQIDNLVPWHDSSYGLSAKVRAPGLPVSIFYNREGREIARLTGDADWTHPDVLEFITYLKDNY